MTYAVEMTNITKVYPGVIANDDVSLRVAEGEIHGLIGENGAGKSTIMNILYGLTQPDSGEVKVFGNPVHIRSPRDSIALGIGMVHQHFQLMPNMTVLRNILLGRAPSKAGFIDDKKAREVLTGIMDSYGLHVDLDAKVYQISVGSKQRVEILKALYRGAKILIMDEPTAILTPQETSKLLDTLERLSEEKNTIILITHKLKEIKRVADNITVMRKGKVTGVVPNEGTSTQELSNLMVGRNVDLTIPRGEFTPGEVLLEATDLTALNDRGLPAVRGVSLNVRAGEIVGIAGVEDNGQTELVEVLTGLRKATGGEVKLEGREISRVAIRDRRLAGLAHIPEDRLGTGAARELTIKDNITADRYFQPPYTNRMVVNHEKLTELAEDLIVRFQVKVPDSTYKLGTLSGGNMQKVVFAREMETDPKVMIAAQPTRGVDIGAIEFLHAQVVSLRDAGKGVLLISAELDEVISLADRILVMYEGRIVAEFARGEADEKELGAHMLGAKQQTKAEEVTP